MNKRFLVLSFVFAMLCSTAAFAQRGVKRFRPARPTLSPYLDYMRRDSGAIPRYYQFIERRRNDAERNARFNQNLNQLQQRSENQANQLDKLQRGLTGPQNRAGITGKASTFNNYGHYYQFRRGRGR